MGNSSSGSKPFFDSQVQHTEGYQHHERLARLNVSDASVIPETE